MMCEECQEEIPYVGAEDIPVKNVRPKKKPTFKLDRDAWISIACVLILLAFWILVWEVL